MVSSDKTTWVIGVRLNITESAEHVAKRANLKHRALEHVVQVDQIVRLRTKSSFALECTPIKPPRELKSKTTAFPPVNLKNINGVNNARPDYKTIQRFGRGANLEKLR